MSRRTTWENPKAEQPELWIQEAEFKKGALRDYVKENYGEKGFTERGTLKVSVLRELAKGSKTPSGEIPSDKTRRRARAALTLKKLPKKKKKKGNPKKRKKRLTIHSEDDSIRAEAIDHTRKKDGFAGTSLIVSDVDEHDITTQAVLVNPRRLDSINVYDTSIPGHTRIEAKARGKPFVLATEVSGAETTKEGFKPIIRKKKS